MSDQISSSLTPPPIFVSQPSRQTSSTAVAGSASAAGTASAGPDFAAQLQALCAQFQQQFQPDANASATASTRAGAPVIQSPFTPSNLDPSGKAAPGVAHHHHRGGHHHVSDQPAGAQSPTDNGRALASDLTQAVQAYSAVGQSAGR